LLEVEDIPDKKYIGSIQTTTTVHPNPTTNTGLKPCFQGVMDCAKGLKIHDWYCGMMRSVIDSHFITFSQQSMF
jgi:hypothetical protein